MSDIDDLLKEFDDIGNDKPQGNGNYHNQVKTQDKKTVQNTPPQKNQNLKNNNVFGSPFDFSQEEEKADSPQKHQSSAGSNKKKKQENDDLDDLIDELSTLDTGLDK